MKQSIIIIIIRHGLKERGYDSINVNYGEKLERGMDTVKILETMSLYR